MRELVEKKEITIYYLQTSMMPANSLTKTLSKCGHLRDMRMLNLNEDI